MPMSTLSSGYDQSDGSEISSIHLHMWQVGLLPTMWLKVLRKRKPCSVVICWRFEGEEVRLKHGWQRERRAGVGLLFESMMETLELVLTVRFVRYIGSEGRSEIQSLWSRPEPILTMPESCAMGIKTFLSPIILSPWEVPRADRFYFVNSPHC